MFTLPAGSHISFIPSLPLMPVQTMITKGSPPLANPYGTPTNQRNTLHGIDRNLQSLSELYKPLRRPHYICRQHLRHIAEDQGVAVSDGSDRGYRQDQIQNTQRRIRQTDTKVGKQKDSDSAHEH